MPAFMATYGLICVVQIVGMFVLLDGGRIQHPFVDYLTRMTTLAIASAFLAIKLAKDSHEMSRGGNPMEMARRQRGVLAWMLGLVVWGVFHVWYVWPPPRPIGLSWPIANLAWVLCLGTPLVFSCCVGAVVCSLVEDELVEAVASGSVDMPQL